MRMVGMLLAIVVLSTAQAADIEGNVVITRKLTKRKVTAPASSYERGMAVELAPGADEDPLVFERERVVIYLEGQLSSSPITATLEQKNRRFIPETLVVTVIFIRTWLRRS